MPFFILVASTTNLFSQQTIGPCGAHEIFIEALKNPTYANNQQVLETFTQQYTAQYLSERNSSGVTQKKAIIRIIPVVVHVFHTGGPENISKAQILSQIDALNKFFRRTNADTVNTPGPFKSIAGDSEIEFRLAQLDPNGNCTDGIVRVYTPLTNNADDNVKALSYWPSNMYLNIWVVKSTLIQRVGYAQFPGSGAAATDGIVVMSSYFGTIGTAVVGETSAHEVGHWLNLRHIWGDDNGACGGSDFVADTPNQADNHDQTCPSFPLLDACTPTGNGVMFCNYMDYALQQCQNMFTIGQGARMNAALSSPISGRNNLWTSTNLALTGVSQAQNLCKADFSTNVASNTICENGQVVFSDISINGPITSRTWSFNGGTLVPPSLPGDSVVTVSYASAGNFGVGLSVSNGVTTVNTNQNAVIHVLSNQAVYNSGFYSEGFETASLPNNDWEVTSPDGGNITWTQNTSSSFSGNSCAFVENFSANSSDMDELLSPTLNAQAVFAQTSPGNITFSFQCAFAKKTVSDNDVLKILVSTDCGRSWAPRLSLTASSLSSVTGVRTSYFIPTASEWKKQTVSINNVTAAQNVRIKFQFINGGGNNFYLDDINISNLLLGVDEQSLENASFHIYPNPTKGVALLSISTKTKGYAEIFMTDIVGKKIEQLFVGELQMPNLQIEINKNGALAAGIYFINATINDKQRVQKFVID